MCEECKGIEHDGSNKPDGSMEHEGVDDMNFKEFLKQNKEKIRTLAEQNTVRNSKGEVVITKNDSWRNEKEWDDNRLELGELNA